LFNLAENSKEGKLKLICLVSQIDHAVPSNQHRQQLDT